MTIRDECIECDKVEQLEKKLNTATDDVDALNDKVYELELEVEKLEKQIITMEEVKNGKK